MNQLSPYWSPKRKIQNPTATAEQNSSELALKFAFRKLPSKKLSNIMECGLDHDTESPPNKNFERSNKLSQLDEKKGETRNRMTQSLPHPKTEDCSPNSKPFVRERDLANILRKNMVQNLQRPKALVHGKLKRISNHSVTQATTKPKQRRLGQQNTQRRQPVTVENSTDLNSKENDLHDSVFSLIK